MTLAIAATALTAISGVVSVMGALSAADAEADALNRQGDIDERNAELARQDHIRDIQLTEQEREDKARENRRRLSSIRAAYGTTGIELTGTPLELLEASSIDMALDERRIEFAGQVKAREGALRVLGLRESADTSRAGAKNVKQAGKIKAFGAAVSAGTSIAGGLE